MVMNFDILYQLLVSSDTEKLPGKDTGHGGNHHCIITSYCLLLNVAGECFMPLLCFQGVMSSYLSPEIGYLERGFSQFL
jgi:hypothetical protein